MLVFLKELASLPNACKGGQGMVELTLRMFFNGLLDAVRLFSCLLWICLVTYMQDLVDSYAVHGGHCRHVQAAG